MPQSQVMIRCPRCNEPQPHRGPTALYRCDRCKAEFDSDLEEGGDYFNNPEKRLELQEREEQRRQQRRNGERAELIKPIFEE
jgi:ribosomal protein L37AE/L43A